MKIAFNKKITQIHWSAFVAAALCFYAAAWIYKEHREVKSLIEQGIVATATIIKKNSTCSSTRNGIYITVNIPAQNRSTHLKIDKETCNTKNSGDTIMVRYSEDFDRIIKYEPGVTQAGNSSLYFAVFAVLTGMGFIFFKSKK